MFNGTTERRMAKVRKRKPSIYYKTEMVKLKDDIVWRCVEMPSKKNRLDTTYD